MKILIIGMSKNLGGIETFFHNYYNYLDHNKYHFDFITTEKFMAFENEYIKNGSKVFILPSFKKHPLTYYKKLRKIIRDNQYDIIHINMLSKANTLPIKAAKAERVKKIIVHSHNSDIPKGISRKILNKLNSKVLKDNSLTKVACGQKAGEWMFGKNANFAILNNAIDKKDFKFSTKNRKEIRKKYNISDDTFLLGNVGRLSEQKNQIFLINVLSELKTNSNIMLMLVGSGELKEDLLKKAEQLKVANKIIFIDNTPVVNKYYSAFDLFVFPSKFEGMPLAPVEAQANGLKCLLSTNITDEVDQGNSIFILSNIHFWIDAIYKYTSKKLDRKIYLNNCFDISVNYKNLETLYDA